MPGKSPLFRLEHTLEAVALIREYCAGLDFEAFQRNRLVRQAVERNLEIISSQPPPEAAWAELAVRSAPV